MGRWHGIFKHRQRTLTSVWGRTLTSSSSSAVSVSSSVYVVSLLLYATIYVVLPLLSTFLDPPWLLLSSHPARFDQPVVPPGTIVGLHHLHGRTSAFKNCLRWFTSKYPTCSFALAIFGPLLRLLCSFGSVGTCPSRIGRSCSLLILFSHGNYGGLLFLGGLQMSESVFNWRPGLLGKTFMGGESDFNLGKEMSSLFIGIGFRFSWRVWGVLPRGSFPRTIFGSLC